jgi:hypothetical protein
LENPEKLMVPETPFQSQKERNSEKITGIRVKQKYPIKLGAINEKATKYFLRARLSFIFSSPVDGG